MYPSLCFSNLLRHSENVIEVFKKGSEEYEKEKKSETIFNWKEAQAAQEDDSFRLLRNERGDLVSDDCKLHFFTASQSQFASELIHILWSLIFEYPKKKKKNLSRLKYIADYLRCKSMF